LTELRRAFLAVVPPPETRAWAASAAHSAEAIAPRLRWTPVEQHHLTLRFFGAVPDVAPVAEFVAESARAREPFTVSLGGGGAFADPRRAAVLWLGVRQGSAALTELGTSLSVPDDRPFRPHLTLARAKTPCDLRQAIDAIDACGESAPWTVDEIVLFESDGSTHVEQARFRLAD